MTGRNSLLRESSLEFLPNLLGEPVNRVGGILGLSSHIGSEGRVVGNSDSARAGEASVEWPGLTGPRDAHEADGHADPERQADRPRLERLHLAIGRAAAFGEDQDRFPGLEEADDLTHCPRVGLINVHGKGSKPADQRTEQWDLEKALPGQVVNWSADRDRDQNGVGVRDVVGEEKEWAGAGDVLDPLEADPEVETSESPDQGPGEV